MKNENELLSCDQHEHWVVVQSSILSHFGSNPFSPKGDKYFVIHEKPFIRPLELDLARKRVGQGKILGMAPA